MVAQGSPATEYCGCRSAPIAVGRQLITADSSEARSELPFRDFLERRHRVGVLIPADDPSLRADVSRALADHAFHFMPATRLRDGVRPRVLLVVAPDVSDGRVSSAINLAVRMGLRASTIVVTAPEPSNAYALGRFWDGKVVWTDELPAGLARAIAPIAAS